MIKSECTNTNLLKSRRHSQAVAEIEILIASMLDHKIVVKCTADGLLFLLYTNYCRGIEAVRASLIAENEIHYDTPQEC